MNNKIEHLRYNLACQRFDNEINFLKDQDNKDEYEERIVLLNKIKDTLVKPTVLKTTKEKREDMFKEIDKHIYKKPWNRLKPIHRLEKVKQFVNTEFDEESETKRKKILADLTKHINNGKLNTKKSVVYDPKEEKILSMPALKVKKDTYSITVEKDK